MKRLSLALTLVIATGLACDAAADAKPESQVLVYGNGFAERLLDAGYFEAFLQTQSPGVRLRSLALNGDQVHHRTRPVGIENHMTKLLERWKGDRILLFFGANEALNKDLTAEAFERHLAAYLKLIRKRHPKAELVFVTPIPFEDTGDPNLPAASKINARMGDFVARIKRVCAEQDVRVIDLFGPAGKVFETVDTPLTTNGLYLTDRGNMLMGQLLASRLAGTTDIVINAESAGFKNLVEMVRLKERNARDAFHPTNAVHYYGVRARAYEYDAEIPHHHALAEMIDEHIWRQAGSDEIVKLPELPTQAAKVDAKPGKRGLGTLKTAEQDLKDFTVDPEFQVNVFASSDEFPELANPLQIGVDKRGRVWAATFATYPVPVPGRQPVDKLLIFDDTDGDGKADSMKVFAENLLLPDGFAFYGDGVIVSVPWKIIWLRDTDGDDKADTRAELLRGLDNTDSHHGGFLNRDVRGELMLRDGVFHRAQFETPWGVVHAHDQTLLNFDLKRSRVRMASQPTAPNPWKIDHNRWGEAFQMFGGGQITDMSHHDIRTPIGTRVGGLVAPFRNDKGCTLEIPSGVNFFEDWRNGLLTGHLLSQNYVLYTPLEMRDGTYVKAGDHRKLIESSNKSFRPVDMEFGLDGSLLISDFYYPIIGHAQHSVRDPNRDYSHGRIWRITRKGAPLSPKPKIAGAPIPALVELLKHPQVRVRELARMELEDHDRDSVMTHLKPIVQAAARQEESDDAFRLELLWLQERFEAFEDTSLIEALLKSKNVHERSMAVRSLRFWVDSLGEKAVTAYLHDALTGDEARPAVQAVSTLSQLAPDHEWAAAIVLGQDAKSQTVQKMITQARKITLPPVAPIYPILEFDRSTPLKVWGSAGNKQVTYIRSPRDGAAAMLFTSRSMPAVVLNDAVILGKAAPHARTTSLRITLQKGVNKLEVDGTSSKRKKGKASSVSLFLTDELGRKPDFDLPANANALGSWAGEFQKSLEDNWLDFAKQRYATHCLACHSTDGTPRVGPSFLGLFGKKQAIVDKKGKTRQIVVDEAYLRRSITDPLAERPEKMPPLMPKLPLSKNEIDYLVRYIKTFKAP